MSWTRRSSSSRDFRTQRCVERCCYKTRQTRRLETLNRRCARSIQLRRRAELKVFLRGFTQNEFIQCEIGHSSARAFVLLLQSLQLFVLIRPHTTVLLAPTIIRLFPNLNLANNVNPRLTLPVCRWIIWDA